MSGTSNSQRFAQQKIDAGFRQALVEHGTFRYGITVLENGSVELSEHYVTVDGARRALRVAIVSDKVSILAYEGLQVEPVEDESGQQPALTMGIEGEVSFDLCVHSVRFTKQ